MKVKELINKLNQLDPNLDILCYTEDEELVAEGHLFRLLDFEITNTTDVTEAEKTRVDEIPTLKLGKSEYSQKIAFINITSEF